jgi:hypothetical protein
VRRSCSLLAPLVVVALSWGSASCAAVEPSDDDDELSGDVQDFGTGPKLAYDEYTVLFTNPVCRAYAYDRSVTSAAGQTLTHKPKDVFCTHADAAPSAARESSPQHKLLSWIADPAVTEIFFASLSMSNRVVSQALCKAIEERNVKITFVLDRQTDLTTASQLLACKPGNGDPALAPRMELRGHDANINFAHNKVFLFNPRTDSPRIVFASGNVSSGVVLHHENWHFVRAPGRTHFAKAHVCLMDGILEHYASKQEYGSYIRGCRGAAGIGEERDIKTFFVPGDGGRAGGFIRNGVRAATSIGIAAHRFSYRVLRTELDRRLGSASPPDVKLVADDDLWWAGQGEEVGPNSAMEFDMLQPLAAKGLAVRYMETNHASHLLHHNKFIVFSTPQGDAAFTGAGNFTGTAFSDNFENFYYITIPEVVARMKEQHEHLWSLATAPEDLPTKNILPRTN